MSDIKDKYASYFNEDENNDVEMINNDKLTKNDTYNNFMKPEPPSVRRKVIKDVQDLEEYDLEKLNSLPFSNPAFQNDNVEFYGSMEDLYENYNDEEYDYELVDIDSSEIEEKNNVDK